MIGQYGRFASSDKPVEQIRKWPGIVIVHNVRPGNLVGIAFESKQGNPAGGYFKGLTNPDNVCFGSAYPHPEGLYDPLTYVDEIESLPSADQAKIMGGNLARILKVA